MSIRILLLTILLVSFNSNFSAAIDHFSIKRDGETLEVSGKVVVEADNGGVLLRGLDGVLWMIQPEEIDDRLKNDEPFVPYTAKQVAEKLLTELPDGFRVHQTAHYVICYNTSPVYAQWCGALYERLYKGFFTYWSHLGFKLDEPEVPLVALVFDSQKNFASYSELQGVPVGAIVGYYNIESNRVNMYDLTGVERDGGDPRLSSTGRINQILSRPEAEPNVATIVHEATHQLAYNSGLQERYADNPFWVSEGMAVYFETPDLKSSKGWRGIGAINRRQMLQFRKYLERRPEDSLVRLLTDDSLFRDRENRYNKYAEAWALNYYLFKTHKRQYAAYLRKLSEKTPLIDDGAEIRLAEFQAIFGSDLKKFDAGFVKYMRQRASSR